MMESQEHSGNQRQSFRCPIDLSRQGTELVVGGAHIPARLLDESAGGFGVLVPARAIVSANDKVVLHIAAGWFEVVVANVASLDEFGPAADLGAEEGATVLRVGLRRVREIDPPRRDRAALRRARILLRLSRIFPTRLSMLVRGLVFTVLVVIVPVAASLFLQHGGTPILGKIAAWLDEAAVSLFSPPDREPGEWLSPVAPSAAPDEPSSEWTLDGGGDAVAPALPTTTNNALFPQRDNLRKTIQRLPGESAFVLPEVAGHLALAEAQRAEIRRIVEASARQLQELEIQSAGSSREQLTRMRAVILEQARRQALDTLTEGQRNRWQEIAGVEESGTR
jgi:hypothetical protein